MVTDEPEPRGVATSDLHNHALKSRAAAISIASNSALIVFKLVVGIMSGSIAIISEALHSGSDLVAAIIAFYSVRKAAKPPDLHHHYGHEKVENLSGVIEALLIIAAAGVIIYEGVHKIIDGPHIDHVWLGIAVMVVSGVVNLVVSQQRPLPGRAAHRVGGARGRRRPPAHRRVHVVRRRRRPAAGEDHRAGRCFDPIAAIAVAVLIIWTGYQLVIQSTQVLLDQTLPEEELEQIRAMRQRASRRPHLGLPQAARPAGRQPAPHRPAHHRRRDLTVAEAHEIAEHIAADIRGCVPNADVLVHIEPRSHERDDGS